MIGLHKYLLIALLFFAGVFSLWGITENPPVWYDEGLFSQVADHIARGDGEILQLSPAESISAWHMSGGWSFLYPVALAYKLFGTGVLQGRIVMILFILGLLYGTWLFIKSIANPRIALYSVALLTFFPVLYGTGKSVLGEVPGLFYLMFFLCLLNYIERKKFETSNTVFFVTGLIAGMSVVSKPIFLLLIPAILFSVVIYRKNIVWKPTWILFSIFGGLMPITWWLYTHILGAEGMSVLSYYANPYQIETERLHNQLLENFIHLFTHPSAIYVTLLMIMWSVRMFMQRSVVKFAEILAFVFSGLIMLFYLRTAGWHRYFFQAEILALIFLPLSVEAIFSKVRRLSSFPATRLVILFVILIQTYQLFFNSWIAHHVSSTDTHDLQALFKSIPKEKSIFFIDTPNLVIFAERDNYYQALPNVVPAQPGLKYLPELARGVPDIVVLRENDFKKYEKYIYLYRKIETKNGYLVLGHL